MKEPSKHLFHFGDLIPHYENILSLEHLNKYTDQYSYALVVDLQKEHHQVSILLISFPQFVDPYSRSKKLHKL